jgi:hypothetical protein
VIAGGAGAVIASRKKTEAVKSELVTHDTHETILSYYQNGDRTTLIFEYEDYQALEDLMPEKNFNVVSEIKRLKLIQQSVNMAITEQIKELAMLKDDGILTEAEFTVKKKELLAKL